MPKDHASGHFFSSLLDMNGKKPVKVVLPGDVVGEIKDDCNFILGPGVIQMNRNVVATKAGVLRTKGPNCIYVENSQKRVRSLFRPHRTRF